MTPAAATGDEEIGWEEFDDLSQLDGVPAEDREFTFEEADAATLAELGLSAEELAAMEAAPAAEEAAKPRRRSTRGDKDAADGVAPSTHEKPKRARAPRARKDEAAPASESPKPARSTRARKADAEPEAAEGAEPKPRRRTTRTASDDKEPAPASEGDAGSGEPVGIWSRFRSARKPRTTSS